MKDTISRESRTQGALVGFAAGDCLGATTEFLTPTQVRKHFGIHRDITGGGTLGWRAGQGTDDSDLMFRYAKVCRSGYSLRRVADAYLAWRNRGPKDIGGTTNLALAHYDEHRDPTFSGAAVQTKMSAGNGSLMCALPSGLSRFRDDDARTFRAINVSAITHSDPRCVDACVAYAHVVAGLLDGEDPREAIWNAGKHIAKGTHVDDVLRRAPMMRWRELRFSGYVLHSLEVALWAICQEDSLEDLLIRIVNEGDDADTTAAIAGGALGARDGVNAIPRRWARKLEYRKDALALGEWFASR